MKNIAATILISAAFSINLSAQQAGDLDLTFGGDGKVEYYTTNYNRGEGLAIQPDQKIVRAGTAPHATCPARHPYHLRHPCALPARWHAG